MTRILAALSGLALVAACQTPAGQEAASGPGDAGTTDTSPAAPGPTGGTAATGSVEAADELKSMRVIGSLVYRQRIALPVDATATISLYEAGLPYRVTEPVASQQFALNGRQVPIPFEIELGSGLDLKTGRLLMQARIADASGKVLWESEDTEIAFSLGLTDLGAVTLKPSQVAMVDVPDLTGQEWMVQSVNGEAIVSPPPATINFGEDGHISGNASCNAYTGSYKVNAGKLTVAPLALTRKACVPPLMQQEQALIAVLEKASFMRLTAGGELILEDGEGGVLTAR
ncbi:META domain-containing protein [Henriciella aquimarina]|uniref:META domain-containing protein n=1 Tax=Henriciella aquimarina TaxID=545261 RepID=UPI001301C7AC|nr:META domain-containing protein [Henriciella aquimarina]